MIEAQDNFPAIAEKMRSAGLDQSAIRAFQSSYETLLSGETGLIPETEIQPVTDLPSFEKLIAQIKPDPALLAQTAVIKLNGGLGTGMGLEKAKSLLEVKDGLTFLDFIIRQVLHLRKKYNSSLRFLLMNSFSTSDDTLRFLQKYPELGDPKSLELMQNQAPKLDAATLTAASCPAHPNLEWCPPGHGDLFPALLGSGKLDGMLSDGVRYLFVSNSDNLGASADLNLLSYFAASGSSFLMEVTARADSDRKGGHLARRNGKLLLRELAQCPPEDTSAFQDITRHRFFNTNSLWIRADRLKALLEKSGRFIRLPLIKNLKTIDPRDKNSTPVLQLETAMGAAIENFDEAGAVVVPRSRFAPVKTTADLFALRSDAYGVTDDWRIALASGRAAPPTLELDPQYYKLVDQLEYALRGGCPSLKECRKLAVRGPVNFRKENSFAGNVEVINQTSGPVDLPPGRYCDTAITLPK
jgi:UDP-N-acetylglucosamine pyrophosphorylase